MDTKSLLEGLQRTLLDIDESLTADFNNPEVDIKNLSEFFVQLDGFKGQLSILIKTIESKLIERMVDVEAVSTDTGVVVVKEWSKNRKGWNHKELTEVVSERIQLMAIDMDTGERTMTTGQMIQALLDYLQPSYWRVGALSSIGLNADAFCEAGEPQPKIRIEKAK